jgi:putative aminopeptidase FrvX
MLKELSEMVGVSGGEGEVREFIKKKIKSYVREVFEDAYGNLIVKKGEKNLPKIMLAAHMDEVGIVITGIEKDGLLRFKTIGIPSRVLLAKRVVVGKKKICGIIGHKPVHLTKDEDKEKLPEIKDLFIDIGAKTNKVARTLITIGDSGTFDTPFREQDGFIFGKALDNRIGCYILIQLIQTTDLPIYYAFTVQEEAGLRGARIAGYRVSPHIALAIDTTASAEWPVEKDLSQSPQIGKGPVITIADRSVICDTKLVSLLVDTAQENNITYQFKQPMVGGTDAGPIHLAREGAHSAVMSIPARYIHSPLSIASRTDIEGGITLLACSITKILEHGDIWN